MLDSSAKTLSSLELELSNLSSTMSANQSEIDQLNNQINKIDKDLAISNQKNSDLKRQNESLKDDSLVIKTQGSHSILHQPFENA